MKKRHLLLILPFVGLNSVVIIAALFKSLAVSLGYYPIIGLNQVTFSYYWEVYVTTTLSRLCYIVFT